MKKSLFLFIVMMTAISSFAREFTYTYEGQTITYTVIDEEAKTCAIIYVENPTGDNIISGELVLPSNPKDGETEFTLIEIGSYAFAGYSGLTSITIPNSVQTIGDNAFKWCSGLVSLTIPNSVQIIGDNAFFDCRGLTSIAIGNSVKTIGNSAFEYCTSLSSIVIPNSVQTIGYTAFFCCTGLTSVTISNSITVIGMSAFQGCSGLTSLVIPDSVQIIGMSAFEGCSSLTSLVIPNSVQNIGSNAFAGCIGLTSVFIPNSVQAIGDYAFSDCTGLKKAEFASIEAICKIEFYNESANPLCYAHNLYINGEKITNLEIPENVTSIGSFAFIRCTGLTSVTFSNSIQNIFYAAFSGCSGLTSIDIPNSVQTISYSAFNYCESLTTVTIPNSVQAIREDAFVGCSNLTSVYYNTENPIEGNINVFSDYSYSKATLYLPKKGIEKAKQIDPWKNFSKIEAYDFGGVSDVAADRQGDIDYSAPYEIYNFNGMKIGDNKENLAPGLYIIRQGSISKKIAIK